MSKLLLTIFSTLSCLVLLVLATEFLVERDLILIRKPTWIFFPSGKVHGCYLFDKKMIYRPAPNNPEGECWRTDGLGLRIMPSQYYERFEAVMIIGDSFVFGHNVEDDESYPYYLAKMYEEDKRQINILNAGIPGTGTDQQVVFLEQFVLPYVVPTIVVWNVNENDEYDNDRACLFSLKNGKLQQHSASWNTLYALGSIYRNTPSFIREYHFYWLAFTSLPERWTIGCSKNIVEGNEYSQQKTTKLFERIQHLSQEYGFDLLVTYVQSQHAYAQKPDQPTWYKDWTDGKINPIREAGLNPVVISQEIQKRLTSTGKKDCRETKQGSCPKDNLAISLFLEEDGVQAYGTKHMNEAGNYQFAKVVYSHLTTYLD